MSAFDKMRASVSRLRELKNGDVVSSDSISGPECDVTPMAASLNQLEYEIRNVNQALEDLERKIAPVMFDCPQAQNELEKPQVSKPASHVHSKVIQALNQLNSLSQRIHSISEHVDL